MTTIAFVRSLVAWQGAMTAAVGGSQPCALFALVDLVAAATSRAAARKWVEELDAVARANAEFVARGEREGASEYVLGNLRTLGDYVCQASHHAEEHLASFGVAAATPRAESARRPR